MNSRLWLLGCSLFLLATLTACGGGGGGSSSTAAPPASNNNATGFAYVANPGSQTISAFTIDASSGALSEVAGSPFAVGDAPLIVTADPSGRFAYPLSRTGS